MRVRWSRQAMSDLRRIREYIAQDSLTRANAVVSRLRAVALGLEQFPHRGRPGDHDETRELVVARLPYIVVYRIDDDEIVIMRVLHGAQRWPPER